MRTNIDIDDKLLEKAKKISKSKTKKGIVKEALEFYIKKKEQVKLHKLFGIGGWEGDLDEMRG